MIGRGILIQSKECLHENNLGGFAPLPPQCELSFEASAETDVLFFTKHMHLIFLNLRVHDGL